MFSTRVAAVTCGGRRFCLDLRRFIRAFGVLTERRRSIEMHTRRSGFDSQADKSGCLLRQPGPIRRRAVVFPLCPYSVDKRPCSRVYPPPPAAHVLLFFCHTMQNYRSLYLRPLDIVRHPRCAAGLSPAPEIDVGILKPRMQAPALTSGRSRCCPSQCWQGWD